MESSNVDERIARARGVDLEHGVFFLGAVRMNDLRKVRRIADGIVKGARE